jgi:ketosteroid isomerase-like protein
MSEGNVDTLRRLIDAWNRHDFDAVVSGYAPDVERHELRTGVPIVWHGRGGSLKAFQELVEAFDELRLYPEEYIEAGDRVIVVMRATGHARLGDMPFTERHAEVHTFRDGLAARIEIHPDKAAALAAVERDAAAADDGDAHSIV